MIHKGADADEICECTSRSRLPAHFTRFCAQCVVGGGSVSEVQDGSTVVVCDSHACAQRVAQDESSTACNLSLRPARKLSPSRCLRICVLRIPWAAPSRGHVSEVQGPFELELR